MAEWGPERRKVVLIGDVTQFQMTGLILTLMRRLPFLHF